MRKKKRAEREKNKITFDAKKKSTRNNGKIKPLYREGCSALLPPTHTHTHISYIIPIHIRLLYTIHLWHARRTKSYLQSFLIQHFLIKKTFARTEKKRMIFTVFFLPSSRKSSTLAKRRNFHIGAQVFQQCLCFFRIQKKKTQRKNV